MAAGGLLGAIEIGLRLGGYGDSRLRAQFPQTHEHVRELQCIYADLGARAVREAGTVLYRYKPVTTALYSINSLGIRAQDVPSSRPPCAFRVMVMGGSTVWGPRVADNATIPQRLEVRLRAALSAHHVEVYNCGVEGFLFQQEVALAQRLADRIQPNLVIFYHGANDVRSAFLYGYQRLTPFEEDSETYFARGRQRGMTSRVWDAIMASRLARLARDVRRSIMQWVGPAKGATSSERPPRTMLSHRQKQQRRNELVAGYASDKAAVEAFFAKRGVPVLFLLQPRLATKGTKTELEREYEQDFEAANPGFADFVAATYSALQDQWPDVVDLSGIFDAEEGEIYWDVVHVNPKGNDIAAEAIFHVLEDKGLLAHRRRKGATR
jgi:lysophospholipase L1-like esterase